MEKTGLFLQ